MPKRVLTTGLIAIATVVSVALYVYLPRVFVSSDQKYKVAMAGQSVTDHWFRRRVLPSVLNDISIWRQWPIPYDKYSRDGIYYQRIVLLPPAKNRRKPSYEYGAEDYKIIENKLYQENFDALMFKFCFTDFDDRTIQSTSDEQTRFEEMTKLVKRIHGLTRERGIKLILGNTLPSLTPSPHAQDLRRKYNEWLDSYVSGKPDVVKLDLFGTLADAEGRLREEFSLDLSDHDSHLNKHAYTLLEQKLRDTVNGLRETGNK